MPFDLDAVAREAEGEPFPFTFGEEEYVLPPQPDLLAVAAASGGRLDQLLRRLLGEEQWNHMLESPATFTAAHLEALMNAYGEHLGIDMGNSEASPSFYKSTVAPSKRTSSGRIRSA
jgi:hypothetical protein